MGAEAPAGDWTLRVRLPRDAELRLIRAGGEILRQDAVWKLSHPAGAPGVYRVEARLPAHGRERTWIVSNPIYLRGQAPEAQPAAHGHHESGGAQRGDQPEPDECRR